MALAGVLASPQELEAVTRLELLTALVELLERGNDGAKLGAAASLAHVARQHPERMEKFLVSPTGTRMVPLLLALLRTGVGGQGSAVSSSMVDLGTTGWGLALTA